METKQTALYRDAAEPSKATHDVHWRVDSDGNVVNVDVYDRAAHAWLECLNDAANDAVRAAAVRAAKGRV